MANPEHLDILLRQGVDAWNAWRTQKPPVRPDLSRTKLGGNLWTMDLSGALKGANLSGADLHGANLSKAGLIKANLIGADLGRAHLVEANLQEADLRQANLNGAKLSGANLNRANLSKANLWMANLREASLDLADLSEADLWMANLNRAKLLMAKVIGANLSEANLRQTDLRSANLSGADLRQADLSEAKMLETNLVDATLTDCRIYGISAWGVKLSAGTIQRGLIITRLNEAEVATDGLEVAQFIYLLLHHENLQRVIDTITSKVVLILGRFSIPERKQVLDALRNELRKPGRCYVPVVFDFEKPTSRTTDETITLLARMARFVIADISDAKSVLQELRGIVPDNPTLPVQPIIVAGQEEPGMFDFFKRYPWFLEAHRYDNSSQLLVHLNDRVIDPVEAEVTRLRS
jgi:uncharacterized protein YjbI with pentapeptide repeats